MRLAALFNLFQKRDRAVAKEPSRLRETLTPITYWAVGKAITAFVSLFAWGYEFGSDIRSEGILKSWVRFDALHYIHISEVGYVKKEAITHAFYPLLPFLLRVTNLALFHTTRGFPEGAICAILVSAIASLIAVICLHSICQEFAIDDNARQLCLGLWVLSPTAVFLTVGYTESLFCALVIGSVLYLERRNWLGAGILIGFSCLARPVGMLAYFMLPSAYWRTRGEARRQPMSLSMLGFAFPAIMLAGYAFYQASALGDPLAFLHAEQRMYNQHFLAPWNLPIFLDRRLTRINTPAYEAMIVFNFMYLCGAIIVSFLLFASDRIPFYLKAYAALILMSILCRSSEMSMPRLLMSAFPLNIALANWCLNGRIARSQLTLLSFITLDVLITAAYLMGKYVF